MNFTLASDNPTIKLAVILESLQILEAGDGIRSGNAHALSAKVEAALGQVEGQPQAAIGMMLGAFINQVTALVGTGRVSPGEGQNLITAAESVIADLSN
jgi:hypothetical protein